MTEVTTLVAGIGNVFLGDDGFGVEVVRRLSQRMIKPTVRVVDFGIRGVDLAYTLLDGFDKVILVDATPRGGRPGTLYVLEPDLYGLEPAEAMVDAHGLVPTKVLAMARALGGQLNCVRIVGCEPGPLPAPDEIRMGLCPEVEAAVAPAVALVEQLLEDGHA